jgi:hypothetical protein
MDLKVEYEKAGFPSIGKFKARLAKMGHTVSTKELKDFISDQEQFQLFKSRKVNRKIPSFQYMERQGLTNAIRHFYLILFRNQITSQKAL